MGLTSCCSRTDKIIKFVTEISTLCVDIIHPPLQAFALLILFPERIIALGVGTGAAMNEVSVDLIGHL